MSNDKKVNGVTIRFMPSCFDSFEGTQEELDDMVASITSAVKNGEIFNEDGEINHNNLVDLEDGIEFEIDEDFEFDNTRMMH